MVCVVRRFPSGLWRRRPSSVPARQRTWRRGFSRRHMGRRKLAGAFSAAAKVMYFSEFQHAARNIPSRKTVCDTNVAGKSIAATSQLFLHCFPTASSLFPHRFPASFAAERHNVTAKSLPLGRKSREWTRAVVRKGVGTAAFGRFAPARRQSDPTIPIRFRSDSDRGSPPDAQTVSLYASKHDQGTVNPQAIGSQ